MNKRIISILLCFVMMFSMLATAVPALAASPSTCTFTVEADKSEAHRGDIITFTVYMQQTGMQNTLEFTVEPPEGLTYVANSGIAAEGISETLGWTLVAEGAGWTESSKYFSGFGSVSFTGTDKIKLMTFQCKVNDDAAYKSYEFDLTDPWADDETYTTKNAVVVPAEFFVVAKPVAVTGVTIDETLSLKTGKSKTPSWTINPAEATNKTVSFKSSDNTVATVNETTGEVTGVKKGTATITITTADGNFTDTCVVTVACSHANKTPVAEKSSDCKNQGWDAYVECDDCGQLFAENGTTEIAEIPFRALSSNHTGGTATCTSQAVCTVCGNSYGSTLDHSYTAETKKAEALKTAGNCRDKAVYYYSCSACGKVENNDSHTFLGDKVANNHVGGTTLVNQAEANHKTQTDGYTGDTKCLGCGEIIDYGDNIPAGSHTPANVWSNDEQHHWKECTVVGCGIVIDGSKAAHSSTGANVATCQNAAVCDVCGVSYGTVAGHDWNTSVWEKDASGHWHKCNTAGCTEKNDFSGHTPDHQGGATEEYAIKCSVCGWIIEQQLQHTHVFDKEVVDEQYKASGATCLKPATYYKSCACGEKGTETFENGRVIDHTEGTEWKSDKDNHWHICTVAGCGVVIESSKAAHTPDRAEATETDPIKCSVCGYEIAPALGHTHVYGTEWKSDANNHWNECACGDKANTAAHSDANSDGKCDVCGYELSTGAADTDTPSGNAQYPQTGDNSMMWLWVALLFVSGLGVVATTVIGKKKSSAK